ncbi:PTS sugar transporter subunit IIA [Acidipropionibacterium virtanenii]|uniref:PTS system galactitol-specific EIIA component n=1 Tax=Acidipropionibacterium virtanenii TaxID=2057246 RepID=A0A344UWK1_9ACTN|nr:PTS system galactitol-specific EIIA component [Acidipropionibacterium virtanenii]
MPESAPEESTTEAPRLLVIDVDCPSTGELFDAVNARLLAEGAVRRSFLAAVSTREERYPTGLDFSHSRVAIPHIDPEHVIRPGLLVCRNARSTVFRAMDDPEHHLDVRLSIWPLVTDPQNQTGMLAAVISTLQDAASADRLLTWTPEDLEAYLTGVLAAISAPD